MKKYFSKTSYIATISLLTGLTLSPVAHSYDTDIYFANSASGSATNNQAKQPNILFIMDTSGSMRSNTSDGISRLAVMQNALHTIVDKAQNVNVGIMRFSYRGGPVLYPVADLNADAGLVETQTTALPATAGYAKGPFTISSSVEASDGDAKEAINLLKTVSTNDPVLPATSEVAEGVGTKTISVRITDGNDDGIESVGLGNWGYNVNLTANVLDTPVATDNTKDDSDLNLTAFRFLNLDIPQGATISDARLKLTSSQDDSGRSEWAVSIEDNPAAGPFRSELAGLTYYKPSGYVRRADSIHNGVSVKWSRKNTKKNLVYNSPNLKSLVKRVVNDSSWDSQNNAVSLFMWPKDIAKKHRDKNFYSGNTGTESRRPELEVTYTASIPVNTKHMLGFHFDDIRIPQGAKVISAKMQFAAGESSNAVSSFKVYAENSDNAEAFKNTAGNISSRTKSAGVTWNLSAAEGWTKGDTYETVDISSILQPVFDRTGWCGGNDIALMVDGTGAREIASFDGDPALAPKIIIEYENDLTGSETGCTVNETSYQINGSSSDADENTTTSSVNTSATSIRSGAGHWSGFNFTGLQVPVGSKIKQANLLLTAHEAGAASVQIMAHDVDSSGPFSSTPDNISTRPKTSATESWSPVATVAGENLISPDIADVVDEVISRPGWLAGANLSILLKNGTGDFKSQSFEQSVFDSARLNLRYQYNLVASVDGASGITVRQRLHEVIDSLPANGGTPATDTLYEAISYLRGDKVGWGSQRIPKDRRDRYFDYSSGTRSYYSSFRTSLPATYSPIDASVFMPPGCPGRESDDQDCGRENIDASTMPEYVSPMINSCQNTYVVLLSDGEPNSMVGEADIAALTGKSCPNDDDTTCGSNLAKYMNTTDLLPDTLPGDQTATLHTIGLDINSTYLEKLAEAGGGDYYVANNAAALLDAFNNIVSVAVSKPQTFAAPSVAASAYNRLQSGNNLYYSMFIPELSKRWSGNVKHYKFDPEKIDIVGQNDEPAFENGNVSQNAQSFWSNPTTLDKDKVDSGGFGERVVNAGYLNRSMYTYTGTTTPTNHLITNSTEAFVTSNSSAVSSAGWPSSLSSTGRKELIEWIRGQDIDDTDGDGSQTDTRWSIGDSLHSQPLSITYNGGAIRDSNLDDEVKIFIGTNAGVFHAFDSKTGEEAWSFIPPEMLAIQEELRADANGTHIYGIDGPLTSWVKDANLDGDINSADGDRAILYVTFGRGARVIYAIDVTNFKRPEILWRIDPSMPDYATIGYTWSQPSVAKMKFNGIERDVLVVGGGYDNSYNSPSYNGAASIGRGIYIIDAFTGKRLLWISSDSSADLKVAGMDSAIPSPIAVTDIIGPDEIIDRLYTTDLLGRLWRIDLNNLGINDSGSSVAHLISDLNGNGNEAGRRFFNRPAVIPFADEGSVPTYLYILLTSGDIHNPLYKQTLNAAFAVKDRFPLLDPSNLPGLLPLVASPSDASKGILDVTNVLNSSSSVTMPKGYFFNFAQDSGSGPENTGIVGLRNGQVTKALRDDEIDYLWTFPLYDPNFNSTTPADACSSTVVGRTVNMSVWLRLGVPIFNTRDISTLEGVQGLAPKSTTVGGDSSTSSSTDPTPAPAPVCAKVTAFTVTRPTGDPSEFCNGLNTESTYWWRNR